MTTSSAIEDHLRRRLGSNLSQDVVPTVMRQMDHLRMLISAMESSMPEVDDIRSLLYRVIEKKLTAKNTNSWATLEDFIFAIVESACSPVSGLFPRDVRQSVREYYEGSFLATASLLFDTYHGKVRDVSWKALSLLQEVTQIAQRTGLIGAADFDPQGKASSPARSSSRARVSQRSPQAPSGLAWFIPADDEFEQDQDDATSNGTSPAISPEDAPVRRDTLRRRSSDLLRVSTEQLPSLRIRTSEAEPLSSKPEAHETGGRRQPPESSASGKPSSLSLRGMIDQPSFPSGASSRSLWSAKESPDLPAEATGSLKGSSSSPKDTPNQPQAFPSLTNPNESLSERPEDRLSDSSERRRPSLVTGVTSPLKMQGGTILSGTHTPPTKQDVSDRRVNRSRRMLTFETELHADERLSASDSSRVSPNRMPSFEADHDARDTRERSGSQVRSRQSEHEPDAVSVVSSSASPDAQSEVRAPKEEGVGSSTRLEPTSGIRSSSSDDGRTAEEFVTRASFKSGTGNDVPDPEQLSNCLRLLEEELSNAKERGTEFSNRLKNAQRTISALLDDGARTQVALGQLEHESADLMDEMERFQDQGDAFFQQFESVRQEIRLLQQTTNQISTLKGILAHTRSELVREKEKSLRAERELAELRDQVQIKELTSQFDYMETSARQLESQASIMQMLLQQTRRQLESVRNATAEVHMIESEIEDAIQEHEHVVDAHRRTCHDLSRLRARLLNSRPDVVDAYTQYDLEDGSQSEPC